ncbi:MAG: hypothetical protein U5L11_17700 [Arhodomonas sp.]|nr:hypothetical protein [Arhodomonas sp.]
MAMGPSFKQYDYRDGLDVLSIAGLDPEALGGAFADSGEIDEQEGWARNLEPAIVEDARDQAEEALREYVENRMSDPAVGDIVGGRRVIVEEFPAVPSSLPNRIVTRGAVYAELPDELRARLTLGIGTDVTNRPLHSERFPWAALNNRRVTLSFRPASEGDRRALEEMIPKVVPAIPLHFRTAIPAYLIRVIPEIRVEGEVVVEGAAMQLGEEVDFAFGVNDPVMGVAITAPR